MKKYLDLLKKCNLFEGIDDESLLRMLTCFGAKIEHFDKKHTVVPEGSPAYHIGIILSGKAQISQTDYYGNRSILSLVSPSETFNEAFACAKTYSLPVSVVADEDCTVMLVDCEHIIHTCENNCGFHNKLIYNLMKDLAIKTIQSHERIDATSKRTTREKLLAYLMNESKKAGSPKFSIPFDRQQLADYLEVERSGLSAEISKLRSEKIIECKKNEFVLL